ncbi:hypothetical protein SKAU_G00078130 [Synaphobranchus kaupii]|uniref:Uncharacterized protein n=1 Tax=Synaphobranchus kaupii TaxID=118154 RepID=A0A9Q1FUR8_SYNKA|nr:hypothetical protein SKAU_G00078120 [Synaphobranchus kaupii]KAJ8367785.1 hypothetical protein SKAU_G00078130 [Synaphobranchus kaupii]
MDEAFPLPNQEAHAIEPPATPDEGGAAHPPRQPPRPLRRQPNVHWGSSWVYWSHRDPAGMSRGGNSTASVLRPMEVRRDQMVTAPAQGSQPEAVEGSTQGRMEGCQLQLGLGSLVLESDNSVSRRPTKT